MNPAPGTPVLVELPGETVLAEVIDGKVDGLPLAQIAGRCQYETQHLHRQGTVVSFRPWSYTPQGVLVVRPLGRYT